MFNTGISQELAYIVLEFLKEDEEKNCESISWINENFIIVKPTFVEQATEIARLTKELQERKMWEELAKEAETSLIESGKTLDKAELTYIKIRKQNIFYTILVFFFLAVSFILVGFIAPIKEYGLLLRDINEVGP
jgi:hypothetical protein